MQLTNHILREHISETRAIRFQAASVTAIRAQPNAEEPIVTLFKSAFPQPSSSVAAHSRLTTATNTRPCFGTWHRRT